MNCIKTDIAEPATNPIWNTTVEVANVSGDQLLDKTIEVTLWDSKPDKEQVFLGKNSGIFFYSNANVLFQLT
jgi:C2 domain.